MEGFQAEDRHNPLPHIALSTTALNSAYRKMASMATYLATELRELQALGGVEWQRRGPSKCAFWFGQIARSVLSRKRRRPPGRIIAGLHAAPSA